eukprot:jgi/Undpi1/4008/HiC_scaffold_16.g07376.m1
MSDWVRSTRDQGAKRKQREEEDEGVAGGDGALFNLKYRLILGQVILKELQKDNQSLRVEHQMAVEAAFRSPGGTVYNTRLQAPDQRVKTSRVDAHVVCASAGLTADAMIIVKDCRASAQQHALTFQEPIPVQKLASHVADVKQAYTQHGGLRPWGVSMLLAGWDESRGLQLYKTDPSGNFGAFKAIAVGAGASRLSAELASGYREAGGGGMGLSEGVRLAARVLDGERRRIQKRETKTRHANVGIREFGSIGMEIATIAVDVEGEGSSASAYVYDDADVERVVGSLDGEEGEGGKDGEGGGDREGEGEEERSGDGGEGEA